MRSGLKTAFVLRGQLRSSLQLGQTIDHTGVSISSEKDVTQNEGRLVLWKRDHDQCIGVKAECWMKNQLKSALHNSGSNEHLQRSESNVSYDRWSFMIMIKAYTRHRVIVTMVLGAPSDRCWATQ